jgi:riboflavin transporter FmnP
MIPRGFLEGFFAFSRWVSKRKGEPKIMANSDLNLRKTGRLTNAATLAYSGFFIALSILLASIYPIPMFTDFYIYEPGDVPIILGSIYLGVGPGLLITAATAVIMAMVTGHGGPIGALMHFISTGILVTVISLFYRRSSTKRDYIIGAIVATLSSTVVMVLWNLILTPIYLGVPRAVVLQLLWPAIIPFNLVKASINSTLGYLTLNAVSPHLKRKGNLK